MEEGNEGEELTQIKGQEQEINTSGHVQTKNQDEGGWVR